MPASSTARSCSSLARSLTIRLKLALTVRISTGPASGSGAGVRPAPSSRAAFDSFFSGRLTTLVIAIAASIDSSIEAIAQRTHCVPASRASGSRSMKTQ